MRYSNLFLLGIHKVVEPQIMNNNIPEHNEDIHLNMLGSCPRTGDIVRSIGLYVTTLQTYLFINNNSM